MCVDWSRGTGHWYIFFLEPLPFFILPRLISLLLDFFHFRPYLYHYIWRSSSLGAPISQNSYTSRHTHPAGLCDGLQPGIMYHKRSVLSLADKFILCTVACHNISLMPGSTSYSMLLTALPLKSLVNIQDSIFLVVSVNLHFVPPKEKIIWFPGQKNTMKSACFVVSRCCSDATKLFRHIKEYK